MASLPLHLPSHSPLPAAYHGPRGDLLLELKRAGLLTARDLATKLSLSLNAVRHHLKELEAEGVVHYRREQRGVGAPTFAYYLTTEGEGLFPQRQTELLTDVLDRLAAQSGRGAIVSAMETRFADLAHKLQAELAGASPSRRREVVRQALTDGGFMAEWTVDAFTEDIRTAAGLVRKESGRAKLFVSGFSRGAFFAYAYAGVEPEGVAGLVILDGPFKNHAAAAFDRAAPRWARPRTGRRGTGQTRAHRRTLVDVLTQCGPDSEPVQRLGDSEGSGDAETAHGCT